LTIATSVAAQEISVHIEPALGQSLFRIGEEIGLKLVFAGQPDWMIMRMGMTAPSWVSGAIVPSSHRTRVRATPGVISILSPPIRNGGNRNWPGTLRS